MQQNVLYNFMLMQATDPSGAQTALLDDAVFSQKGKNAFLNAVSANTHKQWHAVIVIVSIILNTEI